MVIRDEEPPGVLALLHVEPVDTVDTGRGVVGTGGGLLEGVTPTGPRVNDLPPAVEPVDTVDTGRGVVGTRGGLLEGVIPTGPRVNELPPAAGCWLHLTTRVFSLSTFTCARWEIRRMHNSATTMRNWCDQRVSSIRRAKGGTPF
jgi:hypothetical protein